MRVGTINCESTLPCLMHQQQYYCSLECSFTWFNTDLRGTFSVCSSGKVCCSQNLNQTSTSWSQGIQWRMAWVLVKTSPLCPLWRKISSVVHLRMYVFCFHILKFSALKVSACILTCRSAPQILFHTVVINSYLVMNNEKWLDESYGCKCLILPHQNWKEGKRVE